MATKVPLDAIQAGQRNVVIVALDVTDINDNEERVRISEERYELAMLGSNEGFWDWAL